MRPILYQNQQIEVENLLSKILSFLKLDIEKVLMHNKDLQFIK